MNSSKGKRSRRRGFRSDLAITRRKMRRSGGAPADMACGESQASVSVPAKIDSPQPFLIYCINIRCLLSNFAELCVQVKAVDPHLILLQETWLNKSVEEISIPGYNIISRRDRNENENRGGIITFARHDVHNIVCIKKSANAERAWHYFTS